MSLVGTFPWMAPEVWCSICLYLSFPCGCRAYFKHGNCFLAYNYLIVSNFHEHNFRVIFCTVLRFQGISLSSFYFCTLNCCDFNTNCKNWENKVLSKQTLWRRYMNLSINYQESLSRERTCSTMLYCLIFLGHPEHACVWDLWHFLLWGCEYTSNNVSFIVYSMMHTTEMINKWFY